MILSKKTAWLLHDLTSAEIEQNINSVILRPRCVYIQDVIDLPKRKFFVSDGLHFIRCMVNAIPFMKCMGKYDLASMELKGMLLQMTEYKFVVKKNIGAELAVDACVCIGEGSLSGESRDINECISENQKQDSTIPYNIDFKNIVCDLDYPLFRYVKEKLEEGGDLTKEVPSDEDEPFLQFRDNIQNKLSHLVAPDPERVSKRKNVLKEQNLNTSQSLSKNSPVVDDETDKPVATNQNIFDESRSSVVFNIDGSGLQGSKRSSKVVQSSVDAIQHFLDDCNSPTFFPDCSFISSGQIFLDSPSFSRNGEPSIDQILQVSLSSESDTPFIKPSQQATADVESSPFIPPATSFISPQYASNEFFEGDLSSASFESNLSYFTARNRRMISIVLPKRHKTSMKMRISIKQRRTRQSNALVGEKFFIFDDLYTEISRWNGDVVVTGMAAGNALWNGSNTESILSDPTLYENVHPRNNKPIMLKICKGPYIPVGGGKKQWLDTRTKPTISYYAAGTQARLYFNRDSKGTLLCLPTSAKLKDVAKGISGKYVKASNDGVSYLRTNGKFKVPLKYKLLSIRFIRQLNCAVTDEEEAGRKPRLNFVVSSVKHALARASGRVRFYLLL